MMNADQLKSIFLSEIVADQSFGKILAGKTIAVASNMRNLITGKEDLIDHKDLASNKPRQPQPSI
jgi:hypothetical protein